jgi:iojap-like ribosome-associated protein
LAIVKAASDKKAINVVTLDMRKIPSVADYFVVASGSSTTQVRAISDNIVDVLKEKGERVWHTEGAREALWILLDCGDVVAHVFLEETRRFYSLEKLWGGVPKKKLSRSKPKKRVKARSKSKRAVKKAAGKKKRQNVLRRNRKRGRPTS